MSVPGAVLLLLRDDGPLAEADVAARLHASEIAVGEALSELDGDHLAERTDDGRWTITDAGLRRLMKA